VGRSKSINWVAISGAPLIRPSEIVYTPEPPKAEGGLPVSGPSGAQTGFAVLRSDRYFQGGEVRFEVNRKSADSIAQIILNAGLEKEIFVGIASPTTAYIIAAFRANKWEPIANAGWGVPRRENEWVKVLVRIMGSTIELFVDDVRVVLGTAIIEKAQLGLFLNGPAEVRVRNIEIKEERPKAFVVMQFTEEFNALYREVIKPTCESFGYETVRGDDVYKNGLIVTDITENIRAASVIVADVTPDNANVFYEVGYAHAIMKPTILLAERGRDLPFDISAFRTVFYENTIGGKTLVEERLKKHLEQLSS
jgi:hypothetical protein